MKRWMWMAACAMTVACGSAKGESTSGAEDVAGAADTGVTGADSAGDKINYALVIKNEGNVTLAGAVITDTFEGTASGLTAASFTQTGGATLADATDNELDVGETWTRNFTEEVSQAELDADKKKADAKAEFEKAKADAEKYFATAKDILLGGNK